MSKQALKIPRDVDKWQSLKDVLLEKNEYHLDLRFVIRDKANHPMAVLVPGGGYERVCSFIEGVPIAKQLNRLGVSAPIVYYRVKERALFPAPQDDLAKGIRELHARSEELGLLTENYSVWGASAGGHLAAAFGTKHLGYEKYGLPKPAALILSYPVISMDPKLTHQGSHDALLGREAAPEMEIKTSIEQQVDSDYPDTFLWVGEKDQTVQPENTTRMDEALSRAGVRHAVERYPELDHGLGPASGTPAEGWIERAVSFWLG